MRVLVVEDNQDLAGNLLDFLTLKNCTVDWASSGRQALHLVEQTPFDVIVLDPPAFIKRRKDIKNGEQAYKRINQLAMRLLEKDAILISASCSMHLAYDRLIDIVRGSARHIDRQAQILEQGHQGADHPVHPTIVETAYLKSLIVRVYRD